MRLKMYKKILTLTLISVSLLANAGETKGTKNGDKSVSKTQTDNDFKTFDGNRLRSWLSNNGNSAFDPFTGGSGLYFPNGGSQTAIYEDGIVWGGQVRNKATGLLGTKVGGNTYRNGLTAGKLKYVLRTSTGKTDSLVADDRTLTKYRVYKVDKDYATYNLKSTDELAALGYTRADVDKMITDFNNWPAADGAPFNDIDHDGVYNPAIDNPFVYGDQALWFVSNDLDKAKTAALYGSQPFGLEIQKLTFGFKQDGPLGNMLFTRVKIINMSPDTIFNMIVSQWSDPDLGDGNDDYVGVDSVASLGYVYNGRDQDAIYNDTKVGGPPAAGYDFFQGPLVPASPSDSGLSEGKWIYGKKNLNLSSFVFYINGNANYTDPPLGTGFVEMYNYQNGLNGTGNPFIDLKSGLPTKIILSGDPITGEGWTDGPPLAPPGDRRLLMNSGPFTMLPGDTQEVVVGTIVARATSRYGSLALLKYYDEIAQAAFDLNFNLPSPPPTPVVAVSELSGALNLYWNNENSYQNLSENWNSKGWKFEGYNVYQYSGITGSDKKKIGTFDLYNGITIVTDKDFDEKSGFVIERPVQFGGDNGPSTGGTTRHLEITNDSYSGQNLVNNAPYYFAVTAYAVNTNDVVPKTLETKPQILTLYPRTSDPGVVLNNSVGDALVPVHAGNPIANATITGTVVDPTVLTGHQYEVGFIANGYSDVEYSDGITPDTTLHLPSLLWKVTDKTSNIVRFTGSSYWADEESSPIVDGIQYKVSGVPGYIIGSEIASVQDNPGKGRNFSGVNWGGAQFGGGVDIAMNFQGSNIPGYKIDRAVQIEFLGPKTKPVPAGGSFGYMYKRGAVPNYGYQGYFKQPFIIWDVTDPANKRKLNFAFVEQNGNAGNDSIWAPRASNAAREYLYILNSTNDGDTPDISGTKHFDYTSGAILGNLGAGNIDALYALWMTQRGTKEYAAGDVFNINATIPIQLIDTYTFNTTSVTKGDASSLKASLKDINVYPNPYFGVSNLERDRYNTRVTFTHLPKKANIKIFTISGQFVNEIVKDTNSPYADWNLVNKSGLPVASGVYVAYVETDSGTKILKVSVIQANQYLDKI